MSRRTRTTSERDLKSEEPFPGLSGRPGVGGRTRRVVRRSQDKVVPIRRGGAKETTGGEGLVDL